MQLMSRSSFQQVHWTSIVDVHWMSIRCPWEFASGLVLASSLSQSTDVHSTASLLSIATRQATWRHVHRIDAPLKFFLVQRQDLSRIATRDPHGSPRTPEKYP